MTSRSFTTISSQRLKEATEVSISFHTWKEKSLQTNVRFDGEEKRKIRYCNRTESFKSFFSSVLRLLIYQKAIRIPQEQQKYVWYVNVYSNPLFCNALFCLSCFLVSIAKKKTILYFFWWKESIRRVYIWDKHWKFIDMILIIIVIEIPIYTNIARFEFYYIIWNYSLAILYVWWNIFWLQSLAPYGLHMNSGVWLLRRVWTGKISCKWC